MEREPYEKSPCNVQASRYICAHTQCFALAERVLHQATPTLGSWYDAPHWQAYFSSVNINKD